MVVVFGSGGGLVVVVVAGAAVAGFGAVVGFSMYLFICRSLNHSVQQIGDRNWRQRR